MNYSEFTTEEVKSAMNILNDSPEEQDSGMPITDLLLENGVDTSEMFWLDKNQEQVGDVTNNPEKQAAGFVILDDDKKLFTVMKTETGFQLEDHLLNKTYTRETLYGCKQYIDVNILGAFHDLVDFNE